MTWGLAMKRSAVLSCLAFLSIALGYTDAARAADQRKKLMASTVVPLSAADRDRETALRARFAQFWSKATGDRRAVYDTFISATPFAEGVSSEEVKTASVRGWWVRPSVAEHDGVILYLHGGGFVAGSAKAYRGLASQLAARTRRPVFVLDYRWHRRRRCRLRRMRSWRRTSGCAPTAASGSPSSVTLPGAAYLW